MSLHTKHDDGACLGGNNARADGGGKGGGIGDVVICGQKQQQGIGCGMERCGGHGGGGVAGDGLQQDCAVHVGGVGTLLNQKTVVFAGNDDLLGAEQCGALQCELQQAFAVDQRHELLGQGLAGQGPEPCTATATQDDGGDIYAKGRASGRRWLDKSHAFNSLNMLASLRAYILCCDAMIVPIGQRLADERFCGLPHIECVSHPPQVRHAFS